MLLKTAKKRCTYYKKTLCPLQKNAVPTTKKRCVHYKKTLYLLHA